MPAITPTLRPTFRFLVFLLLACTLSSAGAQLRIEIAGVGANQIPIAVTQFSGTTAMPQDIPQIVRDDLVRSGLFRSVDPAGAVLSENSPIDHASWKVRGADALVTGSINRLADGRYDIRFKLHDTVNRASLGGLALTASDATLRLSAHRIADFVYEKLTGVKGVFSTRIAYIVKQGQRFSLQIADSDGQNAQSALISREPIISPAWSPDGTRIAYVSFESRKPVIYVHDIPTGRRIPVANFKGSNSSPAWSPDGRSLVVVLTRDGNSQIYLINADGSGAPRRLSQSAGIDTEAVFSPDGQSLYFTSDRGGSPQVYRMPAAGGEAKRVTFNGSYNVSPDISPDGKLLSYITRREGRFQVATLDLGTNQEAVLTDSGRDESPSFAPNGKMLLYATEIGGRGLLGTVSIDGRVRQRLTVQGSDVREPTWGPFLQ